MGTVFFIIAVSGLLAVIIMRKMFGEDFGMRKQDPNSKEWKDTPQSVVASLIGLGLWVGIVLLILHHI